MELRQSVITFTYILFFRPLIRFLFHGQQQEDRLQSSSNTKISNGIYKFLPKFCPYNNCTMGIELHVN